MTANREAIESLRAERIQLAIDLDAIVARREPWIPGRDADRLRKRLALVDEMLSDEMRRAGLNLALSADV